MSDFTIQAHTRSVFGKKNKSIRTAGQLPAVLYGHGVDTRPLFVAQNDFLKVYRKAGESTLIDLIVDEGKPVKAIIQDVQRHPVSGHLLHIDLHQVKMTERVHTEILLDFNGEAPAVKELGGIMMKNLDRVKVEALPGDLVTGIAVDVSVLKTFEDVLHVRDLVLPRGIIVLDQPDEVIALVTPPRSEQELAELETKVDEKVAVEQVEGVKEEPEALADADATPEQTLRPQQRSRQPHGKEGKE